MPTAGRVRGSVSEGDQPVSESVHNAGDVLSKLLLTLDIALTGDHDALGLGRTGPVEGLGAVAHGAGTQGEVFDEAENPHAVFRGGAGAVLHVFGLYRSTLAAPRLAGGY